MMPAREVRRTAPAGEERRTNGSIPARILLADDDDWLCACAVRHLSTQGYRVFDVGSGDEALLMLAAMRDSGWPSDGIDLVMLDAHMPGCDGVEVLRLLRATWWGLPVIVMSFPEPGLYRRVDSLHGRLLMKPFSLDDLSTAVARALDPALRVRGVP